MEKLLIAAAGGSFPGGVFMAGAVQELVKKFEIKKASGASSGAINVVAAMSGNTYNLVNLWLEALSGFKKLTTFNPKKIIRNNGIFLISEFADIMFSEMEVEGYFKKCQNTLIVYTELSQRIFSTNRVTITDRLLFPWLILPGVRQGIGMNTVTVDIEKIPESERLTVLKASCCLPFFQGLPVKINNSIAFDGQMNEDLGGMPELLKAYEYGDYVALMFRYETGSLKNAARSDEFYGLCDYYDIPRSHTMIIAPEQKLPASGHYDMNFDNYLACAEIGREVARSHMK